MYTSQSLSYSYAPTTSAPSQPGYLPPSEPRRLVDDDKDKSAGRQSLPSIHEALGNDNHLPYPSSASAPPSQSGHSAPPPPPQHLLGRAGVEGPSGPPNPFSNGAASTSLMREPTYPSHPTQLHTETSSRTSLPSVNTQDSRNASLQSLSTGRSPTQSAKTAMTSITGSQNSTYDYSAPPSAGSIASPVGHGQFPSNYSFNPSQQPHPPPAHLPNGSSYHPSQYDGRAYSGVPRMDDGKNGFASRPHPPQPHSESVKRHLDIYDVETSLNEVSTLNPSSGVTTPFPSPSTFYSPDSSILPLCLFDACSACHAHVSHHTIPVHWDLAPAHWCGDSWCAEFSCVHPRGWDGWSHIDGVREFHRTDSCGRPSRFLNLAPAPWTFQDDMLHSRIRRNALDLCWGPCPL